MTITTNTLGSNSAEFVVINESMSSIANTIGSFLTTHGWTAVSGVGTTVERVFSAPCASGGTKYVKLNAPDLTLDAGQSFSGTSGSLVATNKAYRRSHYQHFLYSRDQYSASSTSITFPTTYPASFTFVVNSNDFYPGQHIRFCRSSDPDNQYMDALVTSYNGASTLTVSVFFSRGSGTYTDWVILAQKLSNTNNPAYVYVSASARHIAIQSRHNDGTWNDWHAVVDVDYPTGSSTAPYVLTSGFMVSSGGYSLATGSLITAASGTISVTFPSFNPAMTRNQKYVEFSGPVAPIITRKSRTGTFASRFSKIALPVGEIGLNGTIRKLNFDQTYIQSSTLDTLSFYPESTIFFRGLGDTMPNGVNPANNRHWAFSGVVVTDLGESASESLNWMNFLLDSFTNRVTGDTINNTIYPNGSYRDQSQTSTSSMEVMGRMYSIKFVTTGLQPANVVQIAVDSDGFADTTGTTQDHVVFSYPSQYLRNTWASVPAGRGAETTTDQAEIRRSQSGAVAFPK